MGAIDAARSPRRAGGGSAPPAATSPAAAPAGPRTGSRRDLAVLWCVNAVDGLGSQASGLVFPLLLLDLGHGPGTAGVFASAAALTGVLLGPAVAVPADLGHRRRLMTGAATLAALAMTGLAVACLRHPPLWVLLGLAFTERLCATAYETAARGALYRLAAPEDLPRAVAGVQAGDQTALVVGPALGGVLFGLSRVLPFAVDAVSYAAAALGVRAIRTPLDTPAAPTASREAGLRTRRRGSSGGLRAGFAAVVHSPVLRLVLLWSSVASGVLTLLFYTAVFVLGPDAGGTATGGVLAVSGAAGLAGSLVAAPVVRRLGARRSLTAATWLLLPPGAALSGAGGPWLWGLCFSALCLVLPVVTVVLGGAAVLAVPEDLQSRTGAVLGSATAVTAAVAPAAAAALVTWGGPRVPALVCTAVLFALALHTQRTAPTALRPAVPAAGSEAGAGAGAGAGEIVPVETAAQESVAEEIAAQEIAAEGTVAEGIRPAGPHPGSRP
ncbi:MFS transporter [Streptomyces collinus]|uniref:MFS transporter n=1 Tax=Streptomyces collinus TaxID=42684 RepID=UPI002942C2DF|nr:MFS transporter [Streptomyces collinus]